MSMVESLFSYCHQLLDVSNRILVCWTAGVLSSGLTLSFRSYTYRFQFGYLSPFSRVSTTASGSVHKIVSQDGLCYVGSPSKTIGKKLRAAVSTLGNATFP